MTIGGIWPSSVVRLAMLGLCAAGGAGPAARADVVAAEGRPMAVNVTVVGIRAGRLCYRLPSGREIERPIEQIRHLQIAGWDAFNEAEKLHQAGRWRPASAAYEAILGDPARAAAPGSLDRDLLVRCRLLRTLDEEGRFDRAVEVYLDLIDRMQAALEALRPARIPPSGSTFLPPAAAAVDAAIAVRRGTPIGVSLARWRLSWPDAAGRDAAASGPAVSAGGGTLQKELTTVESLVAAGRFDEALARLEPFQNEAAGRRRADVFYWQGRAWLGRAGAGHSAENQADARRAGLAFLRVAIHTPGHPLAPEALGRAGRICRQQGRPDLAAALWSEVARVYPATDPWGARARQALQAEAATRPAGRAD